MLLHAALWGLAYATTMSVTFAALLFWDPEIWLGDYPPDVRERFGEPSSRAQRRKRLVRIPVLALLLAFPCLALLTWAELSPAPLGFVEAFTVPFVVVQVFNLVDLVILDWLLFVRIRPRRLVLPGTADCAGYDDDAFHAVASLKGLVASIPICALIAAAAVALDRLG